MIKSHYRIKWIRLNNYTLNFWLILIKHPNRIIEEITIETLAIKIKFKEQKKIIHLKKAPKYRLLLNNWSCNLKSIYLKFLLKRILFQANKEKKLNFKKTFWTCPKIKRVRTLKELLFKNYLLLIFVKPLD